VRKSRPGVASAAAACTAAPLASPLAASRRSAVCQVPPSALTLIAKSSLPLVPISARPPKPVWNSRLAVSLAAALLILT
jgi:hypothetical protein